MGQSPYSIIANCEGGFSPPIIDHVPHTSRAAFSIHCSVVIVIYSVIQYLSQVKVDEMCASAGQR